VPELRHREVETRHGGTAHRHLDPELTRAASELQRAQTGDVAERADLVLGRVVDAPSEAVPAVQLLPVARLILVGLPLPVLPILLDVLRSLRGRHRSSHPPSRSWRAATRPAAIESAISSGRRPPRSKPSGLRTRARSSSSKPC